MVAVDNPLRERASKISAYVICGSWAALHALLPAWATAQARKLSIASNSQQLGATNLRHLAYFSRDAVSAEMRGRDLTVGEDAVNAVQASWEVVCANVEEVGCDVIIAFVQSGPEVAAMFPHFGSLPLDEMRSSPALRRHGVTVVSAVGRVVAGLSDLASVERLIDSLAVRHASYGVTDAMVAQLGGAVTATLEKHLVPAGWWTPDVQAAWGGVFGAVAARLIGSMAAVRALRLRREQEEAEIERADDAGSEVGGGPKGGGGRKSGTGTKRAVPETKAPAGVVTHELPTTRHSTSPTGSLHMGGGSDNRDQSMGQGGGQNIKWWPPVGTPPGGGGGSGMKLTHNGVAPMPGIEEEDASPGSSGGELSTHAVGVAMNAAAPPPAGGGQQATAGPVAAGRQPKKPKAPSKAFLRRLTSEIGFGGGGANDDDE